MRALHSSHLIPRCSHTCAQDSAASAKAQAEARLTRHALCCCRSPRRSMPARSPIRAISISAQCSRVARRSSKPCMPSPHPTASSCSIRISAVESSLGLDITILVGTMTGTAQLVAQELELRLDDGDTTARAVLMDNLDAGAIEPGKLYLICTSTYGQGDVPDNAKQLYESLQAQRPDLSSVSYGVIALGDRTYNETFCNGGRRFDAVLAELGARRVGDLLLHDASAGTMREEAASEWIDGWVALCREHFRASAAAGASRTCHSRRPVAGKGRLDIPCFVKFRACGMPAVKISSKVDEKVWNDLKELADETHQNVSGLLTEAIRDYVQRRRVRPDVMKHLERSLDENEELGRLLAQ